MTEVFHTFLKAMLLLIQLQISTHLFLSHLYLFRCSETRSIISVDIWENIYTLQVVSYLTGGNVLEKAQVDDKTENGL